MFEPSWRTTVQREEVSIILGALLLGMMAKVAQVMAPCFLTFTYWLSEACLQTYTHFIILHAKPL